jgi:hypothetical protein
VANPRDGRRNISHKATIIDPSKATSIQGSWVPYRRKEPLPSPGGSPLHGGAAEEEVGDGDGDELVPSADGVVVRWWDEAQE